MFSFELLFLLGVVFLFFGLPAIVRSMEYPSRVKMFELSRNKVPELQLKLLDKEEDDIRKLDFQSSIYFTIPKISSKNFSQFFIDLDNNIATVGILTNIDGKETQYYREIITSYDGGSAIITKSSASLDAFYSPKYIMTTSFFKLKDFQLLFYKHKQLRKNLEKTNPSLKAITIPQGELLKFQETMQQDILDYQLQRGILRKTKDGKSLKGTWRMMLSILSHVLSLSDFGIKSSTKVLAIGYSFLSLLIAGILLPYELHSLAISAIILKVTYGSVFILFGFLTGILFDRKPFPWLFLGALIPSFYILQSEQTIRTLLIDFILLYLSAGWTGYRIKTFNETIGGKDNLIYPIGMLVITLFLMLLL